MNFGLGLVLSLTDNATAGINNAVNSLTQLTKVAEDASNSLNKMASLSALSVVANQVGNAFNSAGAKILSTFSQIIGTVNETGRTLMYAENQLNALYASSGKTGAEVISQIQKYAKESMFDFENLIPAVTSLKSVGIEAFDNIASSTGNAHYNLLDYASALASFAPQMKNAYGTGINAAIGAMREYIAEGNSLSLKRGAGLDILDILGEDKGASIAERTRQVADLVEQLGMLGMVDMMKNSPQVKLSNMGDVLFQLKGMISDSDIGGLSTKMNEFIDVFYNFVTSISDARLETIAKNIGNALSSLIDPVIWLSKKLVDLADGFVRLVENNPMLVKFITAGVALGGVLFVLAGVFLKITSALSGFSLLVLASGKSFSALVGTFKAGAVQLAGVMLPLIAKMGLFYLAWKSDLFGIRTSVTYFANNLVSSFKTARQAVDGNVEDLISTMQDLESRGDFFSNLTLGIMKVQMVFKALADAWGDYELSEDNFLKAKELGILPLIEAILDLKYRFEHFVKGFKDGMSAIGTAFSEFFLGIASKAEGTFLEPIINGFTDFFKLLSSGDAQAWYDFGQSFAIVVTGIALLASGMKVVGAVAKVLSFVGTILSGVVSFFSSTAGGFVLWIGGAMTALTNFVDMFNEGFSWVKEAIMLVGIALAAVGAVILGAPAFIAGVIGAIVGAIATAIIVIKDNWTSIREFFIDVGNNIADFFVGLWEKLEYGFGVVADTITAVLKSAVNGVLNFIGGVINGVIHGINRAIGIINAIPGVNIPIIGTLNIPQLAKGGIIDSPTLSVIGEAGTEAVMPLENNTGWISNLAGMITSQMEGMQPTNTHKVSSSNQGSQSQRYLTNNTTTNNHTVQGNTDNSVVFNQGAIQVTVQNATEEEAVRLAKKVMEYIKRQRELDSMLSYA